MLKSTVSCCYISLIFRIFADHNYPPGHVSYAVSYDISLRNLFVGQWSQTGAGNSDTVAEKINMVLLQISVLPAPKWAVFFPSPANIQTEEQRGRRAVSTMTNDVYCWYISDDFMDPNHECTCPTWVDWGIKWQVKRLSCMEKQQRKEDRQEKNQCENNGVERYQCWSRWGSVSASL